MNRVQIAIIVIGGMIFIYGCREWQLKTVAKEMPRTISAAELADRGPGNNAHIILTGFSLCDDFVYETENSKSGPWKKVWVPAVPAGQPFNSGNVRIIITDSTCRNQADVASMSFGTLQGLVINKVSSLGSKERKLLEESYPGSNFSTCWIVERGRKPMAAGLVVSLMGGGGFVALFGVALIVHAKRQGR